MPHALATRSRSAATRALTSAIALLSAVRSAHASMLTDPPDCGAFASSFKCSMIGVLRFLDAAAWVLGIVLVVVVAAAVHIYRKNKNSARDGL